MSRPFLLAALLLLLASLGAGVLTPDEPWPPNRLHVADRSGVWSFASDASAPPSGLTGLLALTGLLTPLTGLFLPHDLAFGPEGALFVSDPGQDRVLVYDASGALVGSLGELAEGTVLHEPTDLVFGPRGHLYVASSAADVVLRFDRSGTAAGTLGDAGLDDPRGLAFSADGHLFVSSSGSDEIYVFDPSGAVVDSFSPPGVSRPYGISFAPDGRLFVASQGNHRVLVLSADGALLDTLTAPELQAPTSLATGPDGRLYVASGNDRVVVLDTATGAVVGTLGAGKLDQPTGLAFSPWFTGARVSGRLSRAEGDLKLRARARLAWAPGSRSVSLLLVDADDETLAALGGDVLTFHGWESSAAGETNFGGSEVPAGARAGGTGSLGLRLQGKSEVTGWFLPHRARGVLHRGGPAGVLEADVSDIKKMP